jgi:ABC-type sugar transport system permease subunit
MFGDPLFWKAVGNTATFAAGSVCVQLPLSLGLALLLNRPGLKGRAFFRMIFFAPSLVGLVFVGLLFGLIHQGQDIGRHTLAFTQNTDPHPSLIQAR